MAMLDNIMAQLKIGKLIDHLKNNQLHMLIVISAAAFLVVALFLFFVLIPQIVGLTGTLGRVGTLMAELKNARTEISRIDKYKGDVEAYKAKVDFYEKKLPAEQEIPALLESLSAIARRSNVSIESITPITVVSGKQKEPSVVKAQIYQELPIRIIAMSGYHELGVFLSNLEMDDRFAKVVDIDVKGNPATPRKHDVDLTVHTYILLGDKR